MTYPDRQVTLSDRRVIMFWTVLILIVMVTFAAFAVEAAIRNRVCISAATIDSTGTTTLTPEVCE